MAAGASSIQVSNIPCFDFERYSHPLFQDQDSWTKGKDASLKTNFHTLLNRSIGQRFYVHEATGNIRSLEGIQRLRYFFSSSFRKETDRKVSAAVTKLLQHMGTQKYEGFHRKELEKFFLNSSFSRLSSRVYDRSKIPENIINILRTDPLLIRNRGSSIEAEYNFRLSEVKLAQSLGVELERNKNGSSGNYTGKDWQGKKLLIIKPADEGPDSHLNPNWTSKLKNLFWRNVPFYARRDCYYSDQNPIQEAAASKMARIFGMNGLIPYTCYEPKFTSRVFHGGGKNESVQKNVSCTLFIDKAQEAYKVLGLIEPKWYLPFQVPLGVQTYFMDDARKAELMGTLKKDQKFDNLVLSHMMAGNGDGHPANYLIEGENLYAIDFGWSFPRKHASDYLALRFMYDFRHLPHSQGHFHPDTFKKIKDIKENKELYLNEMGKYLARLQGVSSKDIVDWNTPVPLQAYNQILMMWQRLQPLFKADDDNDRYQVMKAKWDRKAEMSVEEITEFKRLEKALNICEIASVRSEGDFRKFFDDNPSYSENPDFKLDFS